MSIFPNTKTGWLHELNVYEHVIGMKIWNNRLRCAESAYGYHPLASPGGKLSRQNIGISEPIFCRDWWGAATGWFMNVAGWMVFVSSLYHSTGIFELSSSRHPSSAGLAGSEVPSIPAASPRGKPRGGCVSWFHSMYPSLPGTVGG